MYNFPAYQFLLIINPVFHNVKYASRRILGIRQNIPTSFSMIRNLALNLFILHLTFQRFRPKAQSATVYIKYKDIDNKTILR